MDKKTRILFYGDAPPVATGFGTVSRNILVPLHNTGKYDITVLGINYWGEPHEFPFPIWPVGMNKEKDPYGRQLVQERIESSDFDILFMIQDSFILDFAKDFLPKLRYNKKFKSIIYFPIDGVPKQHWVEAMAEADYPVTYTDFGFKECVNAFPPIKEKLRIIPHGVNINDFYPADYKDVLEFRTKYFGPLADRFIVTNVNRNQQRKDIPRTILAFKEFKERIGREDGAVLYLHMAVNDQGWKLDEVVNACGLEINKDVVFPVNFGPNRGFPIEILNMIYNCSDVVISSTTGEGWGLAQVEAMATNTPVVSPDNTACSEIVGGGKGMLVNSGHDLEHFTVLPHDNEVLRPIISIDDMASKLEMLYNDEVLRHTVAEKGMNWARNSLVWEDNIVPTWESLVDEAAEALDSQEDEFCYGGAMEV